MCLSWFRRETFEVVICSDSGNQKNAYCPRTETRRYYKKPRVGEPVAPVETCTLHYYIPPDPPPPPDDTVVVDVCATSHVLPGKRCPKPYLKKRFKKTEVPTTTCALHDIPYANQAPPRVGMDFYQLVAFDPAQIRRYLDGLVDAGGSVLRLFGDYVWPVQLSTAGWRNSLYKQVGTYVEHGGPYNGQVFPIFTIAATAEYGEPWNDATWAKYRAIFTMCAERGIRVTWSVLDGCSIKDYSGGPPQTRYQPLLQNIQHLGAEAGVPNEYTRFNGTKGKGLGVHTGGIFGGFGSEAGGRMKEYMVPLIRKAVDTLSSAPGLDWRIMPMNEAARKKGKNETQAQVDAILRDYLDFWIVTLRGLNVPNNRIVLSITGTNEREAVILPLLKKHPGVVEQIHGPNSDISLREGLEKNPKAEWDGDGFDKKAKGYKNDYGFALPSIDQCRGMRQIMIEKNVAQYSTFNGHAEGKAGPWQDPDKAGWGELMALSGRM